MPALPRDTLLEPYLVVLSPMEDCHLQAKPVEVMLPRRVFERGNTEKNKRTGHSTRKTENTEPAAQLK
eukprot:5074274-Amphidinium_carterae.1